MSEDEEKFKRYLVGELLWELSEHPSSVSPFDSLKEDSIEVVTFEGYANMRIKVASRDYDVRLSWRKDTAPTMTPVE